MNWLLPYRDGCVITVKVTPRAKCSQISGAEMEWLRVRLQAPPVDNKANIALIALLAKTFKLPKSSVEIITGETARLKRCRLHGLDPEAARACVSAVCARADASD